LYFTLYFGLLTPVLHCAFLPLVDRRIQRTSCWS